MKISTITTTREETWTTSQSKASHFIVNIEENFGYLHDKKTRGKTKQ